MFDGFLQRWRDWTGDKSLSDAIRAQLRRSGYAVHASQTRDVHLAAVERPGWVQVWTFRVETHRMSAAPNAQVPNAREPVLLYGVSLNDGRKTGTKVLLTEDEPTRRQQLEAWAEGLLRRPERR
ncbi:hypothetical protein [Botrimarina mediterranea]|uniref:Uncharacterized protein n=1 Tax=Botrimarina mediterranea TaxID=2528022 RepID=A0A518K8W1_9BACT|nr:hypothetical protein [Botrimarina mediterranea]QDV74234.1 hypothetical protein Spa11_24340 [Botrimarina mediterranea]QDV78865.1 hypothetical protein K2D_24730 [Planctomycetes bacterium K2D]